MAEEEESQYGLTFPGREIRTESLGTQQLTIRFVGRSREMEAALDHLLPREPDQI